MSHLINIFLEPTKVFEELKEKPTFVVPFIVVTLAMIAMSFAYFMKVDGEWFIDHSLAASAQEMTKAQIAQAKSFMPGTKVMGYISVVTTPLFMIFMTALMGLYYFVAGKVTGSAVSFKHGVSLSVWSSVPMVLSAIVVLVGVFMMTPQTSLESLMLTNLDPLLIQLPVDSPWKKLASSFSFISIWNVFLAALGWKVWGKTSWVEAITVAIIPSLVIYGIMAVWALI